MNRHPQSYKALKQSVCGALVLEMRPKPQLEEHRLARAPRAQIQAEVLLLYGDIVLSTNDTIALVSAEL